VTRFTVASWRDRQEKEKGMEGARLYVGNLKYAVTKEQLEKLFGQHGTVKEVTVIEGKGFSFVEMASPEEALKAKDALNGQDYEGRTLRIDIARPPKARDDRPPRDDRY
jgi:RNA recognition motif-containing protein